jgi:hypothetical protein
MGSSFIPMATSPTHEELLNAIKDGFAHFNQKIPMVTMELVGPIHREPYVTKGMLRTQRMRRSILLHNKPL